MYRFPQAGFLGPKQHSMVHQEDCTIGNAENTDSVHTFQISTAAAERKSRHHRTN